MSLNDTDLFQHLKETVESRFRERHPSATTPIREWKGQTITDFQEDLMETVQGRISEKWFYTHIKAAHNEKLPRIDMLNLLARYSGFRDWQEFTHQRRELQGRKADAVVADTDAASIPSKSSFGTRRKVFVAAAAMAILCSVALILGSRPRMAEVTFCFVDAYSREPIPDEGLKMQLLREGESPSYLEGGKGGCLSLETSEDMVRFVVEAPYYKSDTILRRLDRMGEREEIPLKVDDYALMIHIFSTSSLEDWKQRRARLDAMIADDAEIFQLSPGDLMGMEMYNKADFINKMTMPVKSLRNIEVLETIYDHDGRISGMRFVQNGEL